jgi:hypothetical protein
VTELPSASTNADVVTGRPRADAPEPRTAGEASGVNISEAVSRRGRDAVAIFRSNTPEAAMAGSHAFEHDHQFPPAAFPFLSGSRLFKDLDFFEVGLRREEVSSTDEPEQGKARQTQAMGSGTGFQTQAFQGLLYVLTPLDTGGPIWPGQAKDHLCWTEKA